MILLTSLLRFATTLISAAIISSAANAADLATNPRPATMHDTIQFEMTSRNTGSTYFIRVGLPHAAAPASGYPVLWMLDGEASYPLTSFSRPRAEDPSQGSRRERPRAPRPAGLIVAIASADSAAFDIDGRALDYTPVPDDATGDQLSPKFGGSAAFRKFLVEELRPHIAKQFPIDPQRNTLFGFSYGGLFTADTLLTEPQDFQRYWAASPSLWFSDAQLSRRLTKNAHVAGITNNAPLKIMLTVGEDEQYPATPVSADRQKHLNQRAIVDHVRSAGAKLAKANPNATVTTVVARDHDHFDMLMHGARRVVQFAFAP